MSQTLDKALARRAATVIENTPAQVSGEIETADGTRAVASGATIPASGSHRAAVARRVGQIILSGSTALAGTLVFAATGGTLEVTGGGAAIPGGGGGQPGNSYTATIADMTYDGNVFGTGAPFGFNRASVPSTGTTDAPDGHDIEVRFVNNDTGSEVFPWRVVGQAAPDGTWTGVYFQPDNARTATPLRREVRAAGTDAAPGGSASVFYLGHVVALLGQSEINRLFVTGGGLYGGAIPAHVLLVKGETIYVGGGSPGDDVETPDGVNSSRGVVGSGVSPKLSHAGDSIVKNGGGIPCAIVDLALSGSSRWQLGDDQDPRRWWRDMLEMLDTAGGVDGVRVDLIAESWNQADVFAGRQFLSAFKPFYTGRNLDGSDYTPGTDINYAAYINAATQTGNVDRFLFDLTGRDLGIFDPAETRLLMCHHRIDNLIDMQTPLLPVAGQVQDEIYGHQLLRSAMDTVFDDPDMAQIGSRGPDLMAFENGSDFGPSNWADGAHPGLAPDGLELFARNLGWAACWGLGLVPQVQPVFDQITLDPGGAHADFASSAGAITTTRVLRGGAPLDSLPHHTQVAGFTFNGLPVERAELVGGAVRVFVPAGAGRGAGNVADWTVDAFGFAEGGGAGNYDINADGFGGIWQDYPGVEASSLGVAGLYDDQTHSAGIVPLRPAILPLPAARLPTARVGEGFALVEPSGIGGGVTGFVIELDAIYHEAPGAVWLGGLSTGGSDRVEFYVTPARELRVDVWVSGGSTTVNAGPIRPGVLHRLRMAATLADVDAVSFEVDGVAAVSAPITGGAATQAQFPGTSTFWAGGKPGSGSGIVDIHALRIWKTADQSDTPTELTHATIAASPWLVSV